MKGRLDWTTGTIALVSGIAADVREITISVAEPLGRFQPGSHINLRVQTPNGAALRTYTCVRTGPQDIVVAVKKHPNSRGGSAFMWELAPGDALEISLPENRFELSLTAPSYLLVAGGIGITPIAGMAKVLAERGADVRMLYAAKSRAHMAYADTLQEALGDRLTLFASDAGQRVDFAETFKTIAEGAELYACGPIRMLNAIKAEWANAGLPMSRLRFEVFGDSGEFAEQDFSVQILNRPGTISVRPDETLLDALAASGVPMIYDCQRGECGLCTVDVLDHSNAIDHRDVFFSDTEKAEGRKMCACVSRFAGGTARIDIGYRL